MAHEIEARIITDLDAILEEERNALLASDIARITALIPEKERLIERLNALDHQPVNALNSLQKKLSRNQDLLNGTLQGIRTVAARLAAHRSIRRSTETYDQHGRKFCIRGEVVHTIEKRA